MAYKDKSKKTAYQNEFIKSAYDRINLTVPKGRKAEIQSEAERRGQSVNGFLNGLIDEALERERAGAVPAGSPAVEDRPGGGFGFSAESPEENICSRFISQSTPDSTTGQPDDEPEFIKVFKRLGAMSPEELDKQFGTDPEGIERYREQMERKRQRLAELNAKAGGLSRAEDAERRRLMVDCKHYPESGDSVQE